MCNLTCCNSSTTHAHTQMRSIEMVNIFKKKKTKCELKQSSTKRICFSNYYFFFLCLTGTGYSKDTAESIARSPFLSLCLASERCCSNKHYSVIFPQDYLYQPERLSQLIMSLPFFSLTHSQAKKRDKGVSLTSRPLPASSYGSLPPAKGTFNKLLLPLELPSGAQGKEHRRSSTTTCFGGGGRQENNGIVL